MAVINKFSHQDIERAILLSLEKSAKENNVQMIILHARKAVIGFYEEQGYKLIEKSHVLFNEIQHYKIQKLLPVI